MKKIMLLFMAAVLVSVPSVYSQAVSVNKKGLLKKIEKSNADIANPKKSGKVATWLNRGSVFFNAQTEVSKNLFDGMEITLANTFFGRPQMGSEIIGETEYHTLTYQYFVAYANDMGQIKAWRITEIIYPNAIDEAIAAYSRAYELDTDRKNTDKIQAGFRLVFDELYKQGGIEYFFGNYEAAAALFAKGFELSGLPGFDTKSDADLAASVASIAHDAGLAFYFARDFQNSIKFFTEAKNLGDEREGNIYYLLYHAYKGLAGEENPDKQILMDAKTMLQAGLKRFPDNANIIESLTDVYVLLGENPMDIIPVVKAAIDNDPENPALWNGLGRLYERLNMLDEAISAFEHVAQLIPDSFAAHYSVGLLYLRKAEDMMKVINQGSYSGQAEYDAEADKANAVYLKSIAPLERALALNSTDVNTLELLKGVAFRLRDKEEGMQAKYEKYDALYKQLVNQ